MGRTARTAWEPSSRGCGEASHSALENNKAVEYYARYPSYIDILQVPRTVSRSLMPSWARHHTRYGPQQQAFCTATIIGRYLGMYLGMYL